CSRSTCTATPDRPGNGSVHRSRRRYTWPTMTAHLADPRGGPPDAGGSLWDRLEPLLHRVQKPARYIGCEDGAATPDWSAAGPTSPVVAWLMTYPDTYEIGLPNQGL